MGVLLARRYVHGMARLQLWRTSASYKGCRKAGVEMALALVGMAETRAPFWETPPPQAANGCRRRAGRRWDKSA